MDSKTEDDLLLHWSGEADSKLSAEIEALLEKDPAAQRYLDELDQLNVLRDELADLPVMNSSRSFALEAVTARKVTRFPLPWIAAAAAVIAVIAVGTKSWLHEGTSQVEEVVVKEKESSNEPATRAKLSKRLFSTRPQDPALERISIARDRARKLRTELNHLPNS